MADIVLGLASSHGPQVNMPPEQWSLLGEKDAHDPLIDYASLIEKAKPGLAKDVTLDAWRQRYQACHQALKALSAKLRAIQADAIVLIGDDQHEQFLDDNMPMFSIYYGPTVPFQKRMPPNAPEWLKANDAQMPETPRTYPGGPELGLHLVTSLVEDGFDVAVSKELKPAPIGHAFSYLYRWLLPDCDIPMIPVAINTFWPPNQPTPRRCVDFGEGLARAIKSWDHDKRVVVMASGGLSHVVIDEHVDQVLLEALKRYDADSLRTFPREWLTGGTSELRNWMATAGAVGARPMTLVDYVPCYRSLGGTGCAMGFAYWD